METLDVADLLNELTRRIRAHERAELIGLATVALGGDAVPATNGSAPMRKSHDKKKSGDASPSAVLAFIRNGNGVRAEEVSAAVGTDAKPAIRSLLAEKKLRKRGERRGTRYFVR